MLVREGDRQTDNTAKAEGNSVQNIFTIIVCKKKHAELHNLSMFKNFSIRSVRDNNRRREKTAKIIFKL